MSSQLSAHAITAHTAITRMSISRCSTLPEHRGSSSAEKCSTSFSTDIATLPSLTKGEPKRQSDRQNPASPFHASPLYPDDGFYSNQCCATLRIVKTFWSKGLSRCWQPGDAHFIHHFQVVDLD